MITMLFGQIFKSLSHSYLTNENKRRSTIFCLRINNELIATYCFARRKLVGSDKVIVHNDSISRCTIKYNDYIAVCERNGFCWYCRDNITGELPLSKLNKKGKFYPRYYE